MKLQESEKDLYYIACWKEYYDIIDNTMTRYKTIINVFSIPYNSELEAKQNFDDVIKKLRRKRKLWNDIKNQIWGVYKLNYIVNIPAGYTGSIVTLLD